MCDNIFNTFTMVFLNTVDLSFYMEATRVLWGSWLCIRKGI